jgi:hypothetical protein
MKKFLLSFVTTAVLGLSSVAASAAFVPVTINETLLTDVGTLVVPNVGKLNGSYQEVITVTAGVGPNPPTFASTVFAVFSGARNTAGGFIASGMGSSYNLYAVFNSTGIVSSATSFTGLVGSFDLYIDRNTDTTGTFGATGDISVTRNNFSDDTKIASSSIITFAQGNGVGTSASAFKFLFDDFTLTAEGKQYFTAPNPFYMTVNVNGDFDDGLNATTPGTYGTNADPVTGDVSANFEVPEPGSIALLGLGLAGLGLTQRRRKLVSK